MWNNYPLSQDGLARETNIHSLVTGYVISYYADGNLTRNQNVPANVHFNSIKGLHQAIIY